MARCKFFDHVCIIPSEENEETPSKSSGIFCEVCYSKFDIKDRLPQVLNCGHSFCTVCISYIVGHNEQPQCPKCNKIFRSYRPNFLAKYLLETKMLEDEDRKGEGFIEDLTPLEIEGFCDIHASPNHCVCLTCKTPVCATCCLITHKKCETQLISKAITMVKKRKLAEKELLEGGLTKKLKMAEDHEKVLSGTLRNLKEKMDSFCQYEKLLKKSRRKNQRTLEQLKDVKKNIKSLKEIESLFAYEPGIQIFEDELRSPVQLKLTVMLKYFLK